MRQCLIECGYIAMGNIKNDNEISRFRQIIPQVIASGVRNLLILDYGLSSAFPTIVIPALIGLNGVAKTDEKIQLTDEEASWLASISILFKLFGSVISGWVTEPLGRKKSMFLVNIPHLIAWFVLYSSTSLTEILVAHALFGIGFGLMEGPVKTYAGEICEASIRDVITATAGISITLGYTLIFILDNFLEWRDVALICSSFPIVTMIAALIVPESPLWLLSKRRDGDALKSLQWLRGWVPEKNVLDEYETVKRYNEFSKSCSACEKAKIKCTHPPQNAREKFKELLRKRTLIPFIILVSCDAIGNFSGIQQLMPYFKPILKEYESPISPSLATIILGSTGMMATIICAIVVKPIGKRKIYLISLVMVAILDISIGFYGLYFLRTETDLIEGGYISVESEEMIRFIPLILLTILRFFSTGILLIPFMMMSELFPFKSRSFSTGITAAVGCITAFGATKSFYNLKNWFTLPGTFLVYGMIGAIGLIISYNILPDTEKRTLEEIEIHFSHNKRRLTDRKIAVINLNMKHNEGAAVIDCPVKIENTFKHCDNKAFIPDN